MVDTLSRARILAAVGILTVATASLGACSTEEPHEGAAAPNQHQPVAVASTDPSDASETSARLPVDTPEPDPADVTGSDEEDPEEGTTAVDEAKVLPGVAPGVPPRDIDEGQQLDAMAAPLVAVQAEVLASPDEADLDQVVTVTDGPAEGQLLASIAEFESNGWSQKGTPQVISSTVQSVDLDNVPPTVVLDVCLDHSGVDIVDDAGASMVDPAADKRVLTTFTMHYLGDRWVLHEQSFPVEVEC
ncbi:hypothetical protein [Ornithinimicrobium cavernae]|uniref:hypothetical protein n=1 Tax=Ornithinimicrobium cavernae TaxID=2666047 RepID=UPI0012B16D13|nr:hypothetical protein [Ornithinimicrobium cavernae]